MQKREQFTSPKGTAKWIAIDKPDTKFKDEGEYRVTLLLKGKDAEKLQKQVDEALNMSLVEAKANKANEKHLRKGGPGIKISENRPYKADLDKEGTETGFTAFTFKAKASGVVKATKKAWTFKPRVFDAKGNVMDISKTQVWGGSVVKVAYELSPYGVANYSPTVGVGVSLKINAVQIIDLKTGNGKDASAFGFGEEEGYEQGAMPNSFDGDVPAGDVPTDEDF